MWTDSGDELRASRVEKTIEADSDDVLRERTSAFEAALPVWKDQGKE